MLSELTYYSGMALGLWKFMRTPPAEDPETLIRKQLEEREPRLVEKVRRAVFQDPENPYRVMFRLAGCEFEDFQALVRGKGLEPALARLHREGVYLTHDEFKGKQPIVRGGKHIPSDEKSFLNPLATGRYVSSSSGSRGRGMRSSRSVPYQIYQEAWRTLVDREFQAAERILIGLNPILPSGWGVTGCVKQSRSGNDMERWFAVGGTMKNSGHYRAVTRALLIEARLMGHRVPFPTYLPPNDFSPVAEWIARRRREGASALVSGIASMAVRTASAALDGGMDIEGTRFVVGGEALTDAKREVFRAVGAEVFPNYYISEVGLIGYACRQMTAGNCVHLSRDTVAVISYPKRAPLTDMEVETLAFTPLLPWSPFVLLNAEMDDSGVLGKARCDCTFSRAGFTEQVGNIFSYGKLTGQGITLLGGDVVRILEEKLPQRFGGGPSDYQLVERESGRQTEISLRVNPGTGVASAGEVRDYFLGEVRNLYGGSLACRVWRQSDGVQAVLAEPFTTASGKILSLHLLGPGTKHGM